MITCRDCAELLLEFVAGELDAELSERIKSHLDQCPPCVVYIETYHATIKLTRQLPAQMPPEVEQRLRAALKEHLQ
jgi:anti-sigma factor RsiW